MVVLSNLLYNYPSSLNISYLEVWHSWQCLINERLQMDLSIDFNIKRAEPFTIVWAVIHLTASSTPVLWFPAKVPLSIKQPIYHSLPSISLFRGCADAQRSTWIKLYESNGAGEEQISAVSVKELLFVIALVWQEKSMWIFFFTISTQCREIRTFRIKSIVKIIFITRVRN